MYNWYAFDCSLTWRKTYFFPFSSSFFLFSYGIWAQETHKKILKWSTVSLIPLQVSSGVMFWTTKVELLFKTWHSNLQLFGKNVFGPSANKTSYHIENCSIFHLWYNILLCIGSCKLFHDAMFFTKKKRKH